MYFFFQANDGKRNWGVTGVQSCALRSGDTLDVPVRLPGDSEAPSPKSIETSVIGLPEAVVVTLNTVTSPAVGVVVLVVTAMVGTAFTATMTVPVTVPLTVAVTAAALVVNNVVLAVPGG